MLGEAQGGEKTRIKIGRNLQNRHLRKQQIGDGTELEIKEAKRVWKCITGVQNVLTQTILDSNHLLLECKTAVSIQNGLFQAFWKYFKLKTALFQV